MDMMEQEDSKLIGEPRYGDPSLFWQFRAIFHRSGLDYVNDRGGFSDKNDERLKFISDITKSSEFATWVSEQFPSSSNIFEYDKNKMHFRATNNSSHGYTYLYAWEDNDAS